MSFAVGRVVGVPDADRRLIMQLERILLYVGDSTDQKVFPQAVSLCRTFNSQLFVIYVLDEHRIAKLASLTRENAETIRRRVEEEGWEMLYLAEDEAVDSGVRTSLHLENGQAMRVLKRFIDQYGIQAVIARKRDETKKLFVACSVPVIGLP